MHGLKTLTPHVLYVHMWPLPTDGLDLEKSCHAFQFSKKIESTKINFRCTELFKMYLPIQNHNFEKASFHYITAYQTVVRGSILVRTESTHLIFKLCRHLKYGNYNSYE
jgi:hypothetical protein